MAGFYKTYDGSTTYHRTFAAIGGMDLAGDPSEVSKNRFAALENMWRDPMTLDGVAVETHPGYRTLARFGSAILGIYRHRVAGEDHLVVHAGTRLYRFPERERDRPRTLAALSPLPVTVSAVEGCAFSHGESLCMLIGGAFLCIDPSGTVRSLTAEESLAYVPVTYYNGVAHEQRNLLSAYVRMRFTADGPYETITGEEGLVFTVFNEEDKSCSVRIAEKHRGAGCVVVPPTVTIGAEKYTVRVVAPRGFSNMPGLVSLSLPATVSVIGAKAFHGDTGLTVLNIPPAVTSIGVEAFFGCLSLQRLYLGSTPLSTIGKDAFGYCRALNEVRYGGTEERYAAVNMDGESTLRDMTVTLTYESEEGFETDAVMLRLPLHEPCLSVLSVTLGEETVTQNFSDAFDGRVRYETLSDGTHTEAVELTVLDRSLLAARTVTVTARVAPVRFSAADGKTSLTGVEAVAGCTATVKYDGRVFFTGNKHLPNTVFYTQHDERGHANPFYVGAYNYFNDGTGAVPNRGFLVSGGLLAVLKADAGGEGEIFFHTPRDAESDLVTRVYPTTATLPGVGLAGTAAVFSDEAVFLGKHGLFALCRCETDGERVLSPRSSAVNLKLLRERTERAQMAVFEGLLYVLCEGSVYLADGKSRTLHRGGSREYEWYYLSDVGSFAGDRPLYRYTDLISEEARAFGLTPHPDVGSEAHGEIYSVTLEGGDTVYYERGNAHSYPVDNDGERTGGSFFPATVLCATDEALYFGTGEGALGCFNTDKRGKRLYLPVSSSLYYKDGEDAFRPLDQTLPVLLSEDLLVARAVYERVGNEYVTRGVETLYLDGGLAVLARPIGEREESGRVHRYYYSHAGHAFRAACMLAGDDGGIPHFAKETVPRSAVCKLKAPEGSSVSVFVRTDRHPFLLTDTLRPTHADAGDLDFSAFDFHGDTFASLAIRERERAWCYKQYLFEEIGFRRPFGLFSLTYSYRPTGRIKP